MTYGAVTQIRYKRPKNSAQINTVVLIEATIFDRQHRGNEMPWDLLNRTELTAFANSTPGSVSREKVLNPSAL